MKVLGISGSPRRGGNTDLAVERTLEIIGERLPGAETEFIRIADHRIEHCRGCRHCMTHSECVIEGDDLDPLVDKMLGSDLILLGAPIYWWSPPGVLKDLIDRTHGFYPDEGRFRGKRVAVITVAAQSGFPSHERVMGWLRHYGAEYVAWHRIRARERDDLRNDGGQMRRLGEFSEKLTGLLQGMEEPR